MQPLTISQVDVFVLSNPEAKYRTSARYDELHITNTIVRVHAGDQIGVGAAISWTEGGADVALGAAMKHIAEVLIGEDAHDHERLHELMSNRCASMIPLSIAPLDIAVWDLAAKSVGLPLHKMLGGYRESIPAYASTPYLGSIDEYLRMTAEYLEQGYKAVKFHTWCYVEEDLALLDAVHSRFGGENIEWMLDVEGRYRRTEALKVGRRLDELGWLWFEAPLPDADLEGYRWLRQKLDVEIIPAGNEILSLPSIQEGLAKGAWSHARIDATLAGGITKAQQVMAVAQAYSSNVELQSWGYSLSQAANLHVMLANRNTRYFEQALPIEPLEFGTLNPLRIDDAGLIRPPAGAGLGIETDWDVVESSALQRFTV